MTFFAFCALSFDTNRDPPVGRLLAIILLLLLVRRGAIQKANLP
jgi:hypothetical protein